MAFSLFSSHQPELVPAADALPGRSETMPVPPAHHVNGNPIAPPWPDGISVAEFAMGCFWGAERLFWQTPGVYSTAVGYSGGTTPNPTYREVCSGGTNHTETVLVAYDSTAVSYEQLLKVFWEGHDPTQGMRQGNDVGTQYRSAVFTHDDGQLAAAEASREAFQEVLTAGGLGEITTDIEPTGGFEWAPTGGFYWAEPDHQQYLSKNPAGYCGLGGTGMSCPVGIAPID